MPTNETDAQRKARAALLEAIAACASAGFRTEALLEAARAMQIEPKSSPSSANIKVRETAAGKFREARKILASIKGTP
jgi:hypothetical protein